MKSSTKKIIPTIALSVFAVAGLIGVGSVFAQGDDSGHISMSQRIAERFNLNSDEVEAVFEEERTERQAEMQANHEEKLTQLVSDGKITEDQKQLILDKQAEMREENQANREDREPGEMRGMTEEERTAERAEREAERDTKKAEMEEWLTDNGISTDLVSELGLGDGQQGGRGGHRGGKF